MINYRTKIIICFTVLIPLYFAINGYSNIVAHDKLDEIALLPKVQSTNFGRDSIEIKNGALVKNDKPIFLIGGMPPAEFSEKIDGLNLAGIGLHLRHFFRKGLEPSINANKIGSRIRKNSQSQIATDILWMERFPKWVIEKWPKELKGGTGFFRYNIFAPRAIDMHRVALTRILDIVKPLSPLSFDMANEPAFNGNFFGTRENWQDWLEKQYKEIGNLNQSWGVRHTEFSKVDVPYFVTTEWTPPYKAIDSPLPVSKLPVYRDWTIFNIQRVTGWFRRLANIVRHKAPQIKIHVKIFPNAFFNVDRGVSPIDLVELSDFAGCDTWTYYIGSGRWAFEWQNTWIWLDMLRSIKPKKPIFNSENHFSRPGKKCKPWSHFAPEEYFYAVLMGEAIHGQYATLIWGRYPERNVQDRPEAVRGIQRAILDIQRLSEPISILSSVEPEVVILYSTSTKIAESAMLSPKKKRLRFLGQNPYERIMILVYENLITSGVPVSFAYEERPLNRQVRLGDILIIPGVTHIQRSTLKEISDLAKRGMKVLLYKAQIDYDAYGHPIEHGEFFNQRNVVQAKSLQDVISFAKASERSPEVSLYEEGKEASDIEWRYTRKGNRIYLFILNHTNKTKTISVKVGKFEEAIDLISEKKVDLEKILMQPIDVKLIEFIKHL